MNINNASKSDQKTRETEPVYAIEENSGCFLDITIKGDLTKPFFFRVLHELLCHRDYFERHTLWNVLNVQLRLSFDDLKEITYVIRKYSPQKRVYEKKMVVVVSGEFNTFIAKLSAELLSFLPFELRIFDNYDEAKGYLKQNSHIVCP